MDLPARTSPAVVASVQDALNKAMLLLDDKLMLDADRLADVIVGVAVPSFDLLQERIERRKTINTLTAETEWLTASELQEASGGHPRVVADWKRRGRIFGVVGPDGKDIFPAYQFDAAMRPLRAIAPILQAFGPTADPWVLVAWFHFPNGWLMLPGDADRTPRSPKDVLQEEAAVVHAAAMHGNG